MLRHFSLLIMIGLLFNPMSIMAADFNLTASPSANSSWTATAQGNLPLVFVAIKTSATGEKRFESPRIRRVSDNCWEWVFTVPPVPTGPLTVKFVAKDPYSAVPHEKRPVLTYAEIKVTVPVASTPPATPPPGGTTLGDLNDRFTPVAGTYPRPRMDNGWGIHWFPTCSQSRETVDRFVNELQAMHITWCLFLNSGSDTQANEHLVQRLTAAGIMPVMRIYVGGNIADRPDGAEIERLKTMVATYRQRGVPYFQYLNEANLEGEWGGKLPADSVERFLDHWIAVAKVIRQAGGIPGLPAPAFGYIDHQGNYGNGTDYFRRMIQEILRRGEKDLLSASFIALHNYATNRDPRAGEATAVDGFFEFRAYHQILQNAGLSIPLIGGEGGTRPEDVGGDLQKLSDWTLWSYQYMAKAPEYFFCYSPWLVSAEKGNEWAKHAWFHPAGRVFPIVEMLKKEQPKVRQIQGIPIGNEQTSSIYLPPVVTSEPPVENTSAPDTEFKPRSGETHFPASGGFNAGDGRQRFMDRMRCSTMVEAIVAKMRQVCPEVGQESGFTFDCATGYYEIEAAMATGGYRFKGNGSLDAFRAKKPHMDGGREIGIRRIR